MRLVWFGDSKLLFYEDMLTNSLRLTVSRNLVRIKTISFRAARDFTYKSSSGY